MSGLKEVAYQLVAPRTEGQPFTPAGVGVLLEFLIPGISESDRLRELGDVLLIAGEEVPPLFRVRPAVGAHILMFFLRSELDGNDL